MSTITPYAGSAAARKEQVRDMFDSIAPRYDLLNHLLSAGIDRSWRRTLIRDLVRENPRRVLDIATGTGDLAISIARSGERSVTGADLSEGMLEKARAKIAAQGLDIELVHSDAEHLPFREDTFDSVTVAFGIRNFDDPCGSLAEMRRVLREGGTVYVLEFSKSDNNVLLGLFRIYFHNILPFVGKMISKDKGAYKYLPESVELFPSGEEFAGMLCRAGFHGVTMKRLTGGIATIYKAVK